MAQDMFNEMWLEECGVCLDEKDFYFKNRCQCKDLVCRDCFFRIDKCPFCRSPYAVRVWQPQHQQHRHFNLPPLLTADDYFRLSDMEIERRLAGLFVPVPGWFPSTRLSSQDTARARNNWNYWFHRLNGLERIRPYLPRHLFNNDPVHALLRTGRFCEPDEAGICVNRTAARHFVMRQLNTFGFITRVGIRFNR